MQASHCLAARPSLVPCAPGTLFVASALAINIYVSGAMRAPCRAMCSMVIRIWFVVLRRRDVMESRIAAAVRKLGIARWISEWSLYRPVYSRCSGCLFLSLQYHGALQLGFRGFVDFLWFPAVSTAEFLFILLWLRYDAGYCFFVHPLRFVSPWEVCWDREMALTWSDDSTLKVWDLKARPGGSPMAGTEEDRTNMVQSWNMVLNYA